MLHHLWPACDPSTKLAPENWIYGFTPQPVAAAYNTKHHITSRVQFMPLRFSGLLCGIKNIGRPSFIFITLLAILIDKQHSKPHPFKVT